MRTIQKFEFPLSGGSIEIKMPFEAEVIHASRLYGVYYLWAIVDTEAPIRMRRFRIVGDGQPLQEGSHRRHRIATIIDGPIVWHVFESN